MQQSDCLVKSAETHWFEQTYLAAYPGRLQGSEPALWLQVFTDIPRLPEPTIILARNGQPRLRNWQKWFQAKK